MIRRAIARFWQAWRTWRTERALATRPVARECSAKEWAADLAAQRADSKPKTVIVLDAPGTGVDGHWLKK